LRLVAHSFLILFFALALIRYVPATVEHLTSHVTLMSIAAFVGVGTGLLSVQRVGRLRWTFIPIAVFVLALARMFSYVVVIGPSTAHEVTRTVLSDVPSDAITIALVPAIGIVFGVTAMFFVPLGAMLGEDCTRFRPLVAYSLSTLGGLVAITCFALVTSAGNPPWMWFSLGLAVLAVASHRHPYFELGIVGTLPIVIALMVATGGEHERWSPYHRVTWHDPSDAQYVIEVDGSPRLTALDLSDRGAADPFVEAAWAQYRAPYRHIATFDTVLVLGAGAGNDVALLLEGGAQHIDVVEIDPVVADFGRSRHPQRPYDDPRVRFHLADARGYLRHETRIYDLIIIGPTIPRMSTSGLSPVPLDGYVHTREAILAARALLAPDGRILTYHTAPQPTDVAKVYQTLRSVFGGPPEVIHWGQPTLFTHAFVAGGSTSNAAGGAMDLSQSLTDVTLPSDDWPFLHLTRRAVPRHDVEVLAVAVGLSLLLVLGARGRGVRGGYDVEMFLLGLGFMLLVTKSVAGLPLLVGSTWELTPLVLSAVLLAILTANWLVLVRRRIGLRPVLAALVISLGIGWAVPVQALADSTFWVAWTVGGALATAPIFLAALAFAIIISDRASAVMALGYYAIGAAAGGVLAYVVMVTGVKALSLIAALAYLLLWIVPERFKASTTP
jgi:spermidine synthase